MAKFALLVELKAKARKGTGSRGVSSEGGLAGKGRAWNTVVARGEN